MGLDPQVKGSLRYGICRPTEKYRIIRREPKLFGRWQQAGRCQYCSNLSKLWTDLCGHDALSLGNERALGTCTVAPAAVALVSLERRHNAVVAAARALGRAREPVTGRDGGHGRRCGGTAQIQRQVVRRRGQTGGRRVVEAPADRLAHR